MQSTQSLHQKYLNCVSVKISTICILNLHLSWIFFNLDTSRSPTFHKIMEFPLFWIYTLLPRNLHPLQILCRLGICGQNCVGTRNLPSRAQANRTGIRDPRKILTQDPNLGDDSIPLDRSELILETTQNYGSRLVTLRYYSHLNQTEILLNMTCCRKHGSEWVTMIFRARDCGSPTGQSKNILCLRKSQSLEGVWWFWDCGQRIDALQSF